MILQQYEKIDTEAPLGAFSTYDMEVIVPLIEAIPENGVYLEVGVDKGKSLYTARQVSKPSVTVYGVDLREDPKVEGTIFMQRDSTTLPEGWDKEIDVLFIDGDHSYEGCKGDIDAWAPFVKDKGVILFHDADEGGPGVLRAITEYIELGGREIRKWTIHKKTDKNTSMVSVELA